MVVPSALADTVTPPMLPPEADFTVPLMSPSAAAAIAGRINESAVPNARPVAKLPSLLVRVIAGSSDCLLVRLARRGIRGAARRRCRQSLQIGDDGPDLVRLQTQLEPGHV